MEGRMATRVPEPACQPCGTRRSTTTLASYITDRHRQSSRARKHDLNYGLAAARTDLHGLHTAPLPPGRLRRPASGTCRSRDAVPLSRAVALLTRRRQVNWDSSKDEALWNIVSEVTKTEIDCECALVAPPQPAAEAPGL